MKEETFQVISVLFCLEVPGRFVGLDCVGDLCYAF